MITIPPNTKPTLENTHVTVHFWRNLPKEIRDPIKRAIGASAAQGRTARDVYDQLRGPDVNGPTKEAKTAATLLKRYITEGGI